MDVSEAGPLVSGFHDATLVAIELRWNEGVAIVVTRTSSGQKRFAVDGVVHLECARNFPWGRSVSINKMGVTAAPADTLLITIEMQSGDVLAIRGTSISLDR
jgi:hypothetical protein